MTVSAERKTTIKRSLDEALAPRLAVERYFAEVGHTYRHGPLYRKFEHHVTRPLLRAGLSVAGLYGRGLKNALSPVIRNLLMTFDTLPTELDGFTLLQLSDFHIDGVPGLAEAMSALVGTLRPDVCVLTGDYRFEDRGPADAVYPLMRQLIASIRARHGIYGILGNHDSAEMAYRLEEMGVHMLVNDAIEIQDAGASFWVAGLDDPFDYRCDDLTQALESVPREAFTVLLSHAPELYEEATRANIDLYLSGHTHGGQIRLPFVGAVRHNARCPREYTYGLWQHSGMRGYTTSGVGCSSLPVRFGCPPEAVMIHLRSARRS